MTVARSAVKPAWYFLNKVEFDQGKLVLVLRIRWNVHQVTVEDLNGEKHIEYEYNEQILRHTVDQAISYDEVTSYIESCKDELLAEAKNAAELEAITKTDIESIRKQPLKDGFVRKSELKLKSPSGKTYTLKIDDSSGVPQLKISELKSESVTKELKAQ